MVGGRAADAGVMAAARAHKAASRATRVEGAPITIVLVACAKKKLKVEAKARDLYTSALFKKARGYAERNGDQWFILSALHGLVDPEKRLRPYNVTLRNYGKRERELWALGRVLPALTTVAPAGSKIIVLAGRAYFENLEPELLRRGFEVVIPMRGMDLFLMMRWLKDAEGI